jgi:beta-lactam-binding protein with PASTA domain
MGSPAGHVCAHHGREVEVPNVQEMNIDKAKILLEERGLRVVVSDSGYNKRKPADCILAQAPDPGVRVKEGRVIYVTVNSSSSPTVVIPDIIDNCSLREAEAKLIGLGFKMLPPKRVDGEKDWVYGIICRGRRVGTGDRISTESPLTLMVGSGSVESEEMEEYMDVDVVEDEILLEENVTTPTPEPTPEPAADAKESNE